MIKNLLKATEVKKNLTISVMGTLIGQSIHLGLTPIISRIYSPELFGQFSLYLSLLGIFTCVALLKYELAIITCEEDEVFSVHRFIQKVATFTTIATGIITVISYVYFSEYFLILLFLTLSIFISANYWSYRSISNRNSEYKSLSLAKISENSTNGIITILMGLTSLKTYGLYFGKISGLIISIYLFRKKIKFIPKKVQGVFAKYINFAKYSFPAELIAHFNLSLAVVLFSYYFSAVEVGLIGLTSRVLSVPANLVSISFFDVFKQKATEDYKRTGEFRTIFTKFFLVLTLIATAMVIVMYFLAPKLFGLIFGDAWVKAGVYAQFLAFYYAVRLINNPLNFTFMIINKHQVNLIFQVLYLIAGVASITLGYHYYQSDIECIKLFSLTLGILTFIHVLLAFLMSPKGKKA